MARPRPIRRRSSRLRSEPGPRPRRTTLEPLRKALRLARVHLLLADDTGTRDDHRDRSHRPQTAPQTKGPHHRRRRATIGARTVEGRDGGAFRPTLPGNWIASIWRRSVATAASGQSVIHAQPLSDLAPPARRPHLRPPRRRPAPSVRPPGSPDRCRGSRPVLTLSSLRSSTPWMHEGQPGHRPERTPCVQVARSPAA